MQINNVRLGAVELECVICLWSVDLVRIDLFFITLGDLQASPVTRTGRATLGLYVSNMPDSSRYGPMDHVCPRLALVRNSQDFEDGCFQTRARRAAQSFGRAALAKSLAPCRVMGRSHKGDRQVLDGQLRWIFWPSGTSHVWPHRSQVQLDYRSRHNYDYR